VTELSDLIVEQERDSRSFKVFGLSLDAFPAGADLIFRKSRKLASDPRHGTLSCYTNLACRCEKCRAAAATAKRDWRRRNHVDKGPYTYRLCCEDCGSANVKRKRVYG
jgi:hypothetical protein